jgi:putative redox protein
MSQMKTARAIWAGEGQAFTGVLGSGYTFEMGSPPGPALGSPMEFLLAGVVGCTAVDVIGILHKKRQDIQGLEVAITGVRTAEHPMVYVQADMTYIVRGRNIDPKAVEDAIRLSKTKYCSASVMFARAGVDINSDYRIEELEQDAADKEPTG